VVDISQIITLKLSNIEYDRIRAAASASGKTVDAYLTSSCVRQARALDDRVPYVFAGRHFATRDLPDSWYEAFSERELISHLKAALRARRIDAANAMAIELLDFPVDRRELEMNVQSLSQLEPAASFADAELVTLVDGVLGWSALSPKSSVWACCAALLKSACDALQVRPSPYSEASS
jgi:hypothetical protein